MPKAEFDRQQTEDRLGLSIAGSARAFLDERLTKLREALDLTEEIGKAGELPEAELSENGISPLIGKTLMVSLRGSLEKFEPISPRILREEAAGTRQVTVIGGRDSVELEDFL